MKSNVRSAIITDGAKKRLFNMAYKAHVALENCSGDEEYKALKKRSDEWNEIVMTLGLTKELQEYYSEIRGE